MSRLWGAIGATSGARIYSVVAGSVSLIISARALGPEGRGEVAAAVTWATLFATVGYLSLGQVAVHRAGGRAVEDWIGPILGALLAMTAAVTVIGWLSALALYLFSGGDAFGRIPAYALALGFATLPFLVWEHYNSALLSAVDRIRFYNRMEIVGRTLGVVLIALLVGLLGFGVAGALVALFLGQLVVAAGGWRQLVALAGDRLRVDRSILRDMIKGGLQLHLNAVGTFLFTNAAVLIVQTLRGPAETGSFQVVVQLLLVGQLIPQAASLVLYGEVARHGPDGAWPANRRVLLAMLALASVSVVAGWLLAPLLVPALFGEDFRDAVPIFQILVFSLVGQTFSAVMAPQWIGRGLFWQASALTLGLGLCNVAACFALVSAHGMEGAAWSLLGVSVCSIVSNGLMALWVERRTRRTA